MSDPYGQMYRGQPQQPPGLQAPQYRPGEPTYYPPQPSGLDHAGVPIPGGPPGAFYRPQGHAAPRPPKPRRKRRIFLWVFLAVQVIFIIWLIAGVATKPSGPTVAQQTAQVCAHGGWQGLFKSHADCTQHYAVALNDAGDVGNAIGAGLIVLLWVVVDFFLGVGYGVYKLATR